MHGIGSRVFELRGRRGMTQEELAEAAGFHVNAIKKIEAGGTARMETYHAIARALGVVTMVFVAPPNAAPDPVDGNDHRDLVLADIRGSIMPPVGLDGPILRDTVDEGRPDLDRLQRAVNALAEAYRGDQYRDVAQLAPPLIRSAHYHVDAVEPGRRRDAVRLRGDLLGLTGRYLIQIRAHDLALVALRDGLRDANEAGDRVLGASLVASQAWVMLRQGRFSEVEQLCSVVADAIEPRMSTATPQELGAWGFVLLRASSAAARNNRPEEAKEYLSVASSAGARLGVEHDLPGQWPFGPLTVSVMGVQNELVAGHPDRALERSEQLPHGVGRTHPDTWNRHQLDRARAQVETGAVDAATETLSALRRRAPGWLRYQRYARDTTQRILKARKRMPTEEQRQLADFLSLEV